LCGEEGGTEERAVPSPGAPLTGLRWRRNLRRSVSRLKCLLLGLKWECPVELNSGYIGVH
jgi:hypothetical protein